MACSSFKSRIKIHTHLLQQRWYTYLKIYNNSKHENCGNRVVEIGQILTIESLPQGWDFVCPGGQ